MCKWWTNTWLILSHFLFLINSFTDSLLSPQNGLECKDETRPQFHTTLCDSCSNCILINMFIAVGKATGRWLWLLPHLVGEWTNHWVVHSKREPLITDLFCECEEHQWFFHTLWRAFSDSNDSKADLFVSEYNQVRFLLLVRHQCFCEFKAKDWVFH